MSTYVQKRVVLQVGTDVTASMPLVSSGGLVPNLSLTPGAVVGDLLVWNGTAWAVSTPVARLLASGVATLDGAGTAVVANALVGAGSGILLTPKETGAVVVGVPQISTRAAGVSFTIQSSAGAGDVGADIYWQLWSA